MQILLISYDFPPQNRVGGFRAYAFASQWSAQGHAVTVLTTVPRRPGIQVSPRSEFPNLHQFCVLEVDHLGVLRNVSSAVDGMEFGRPGLHRESLSTRLKRRMQRVRAWIGDVSYFCPSNRWIRPALKTARDAFKDKKFDLVVSSSGPISSHLIASKLREEFNFFWVADFRDLWAELHLVKIRPLFRWFEMRREIRTMAAADLLISVSEPLVSRLRELHPGHRCELVPNGFFCDPPGEATPQSPVRQSSQLRIVYAGTLFLSGRDPLVLLKGIELYLSEHPESPGDLVVEIYAPDASALAPHIAASRLDGIVKLHQVVSNREIARIQSDSDAVLFLDWNVPGQTGILSGKLFECAASGKPVLVIGSVPDTVAAHFILANGFGISWGGTAQSIRDGLASLFQTGTIPYFPNNAALEPYKRSTIAKRLLSQIEALMQARGSGHAS